MNNSIRDIYILGYNLRVVLGKFIILIHTMILMALLN